MRRLFISLLLLATLAGVLIAWQLSRSRESEVATVPVGDFEFAWIQAATSSSAWERLVTGVHRVTRDWPEFMVDDSRAYPEDTTSIPELTVSSGGRGPRIHIRWYKLSKGAQASTWATRLANRDPAPLVVIGGGSSDRALDLAEAMAAQKRWHGSPPLLVFTTATATSIPALDSPTPVDLMQVYPGRSFRMCFTNENIANALIDFVWSHHDLKPYGNPLPVVSVVGSTDPWLAAATLTYCDERYSPSAYALQWEDDPYSVDLFNHFHQALHDTLPGRIFLRERISIPYSIGGQYASNPAEADAAERLLNGLCGSPMERQLLILPTAAAPARRVLRSITGAIPLVGRNLVAITGDSISLNNVYRDSDIGWSVRAVPVPLVFFAHQNPVAWDVQNPDEDRTWPVDRMPHQFSEADAMPLPGMLMPPTNTDDTLLNCDLAYLLARTALGWPDAEFPNGPVADSTALQTRLTQLSPAIFDANGNRLGGTGEYILCLKPQFAGPPAFSQVLSTATLEVWTRDDAGPPSSWRPVKRVILEHGRTNRPNF